MKIRMQDVLDAEELVSAAVATLKSMEERFKGLPDYDWKEFRRVRDGLGAASGLLHPFLCCTFDLSVTDDEDKGGSLETVEGVYVDAGDESDGEVDGRPVRRVPPAGHRLGSNRKRPLGFASSLRPR